MVSVGCFDLFVNERSCARIWTTKQAGNSARAKKPIRTRFNRMEWSWYFFFVRLSISMNLHNFCQLTAIRDYDKATHSLLDAIYYSPIWWFYAWVTKGIFFVTILQSRTAKNDTKIYQKLWIKTFFFILLKKLIPLIGILCYALGVSCSTVANSFYSFSH